MNLLNWERINTYSWMLLAVYLVIAGWMVFTGPGLVDRNGLPKGADFVGFYAASSLAASGRAADAYNPRIIESVENRIIGADFTPFTWNYPPTFQLILLPFAHLPYLYSLLAWVVVTLAGYVLVVRRFAPHRLTTRILLAYPGVFQCALQGQNGFLTAVLMGGGLLLLESHPVAAGAVLGLLTYKPQLALPAFVALAAGRCWKALAAAICSAACLAGVSLLVLGVGTWQAFLDNIRFISSSSVSGMYPLFKMPTAYGAARLLGSGNTFAMVLQSAVTLLAVASVIYVWSRSTSRTARVSVLVTGTLLAFPFIYDYDLVVLAIALACIGWEGHRKGWLPGEKAVLALAWMLPIVSTALAKVASVQVGPIFLVLLLLVALRRAASRREGL